MQDRVPLSQAIDKSPTVTHSVKEANRVSGPLSFMDDMDYHRMADFFDLSYDDRKDDHIAEKLSFLTDWASNKTKSKDRLDFMEALRTLQKGLGLNLKGKELVKKLHQYTRLDLDRQRIEREMNLLKDE